jgi:hypothetical protein
MLRLALFAVALVGVIATAQPSFADPVGATTSDDGQTAAVAATQQVASPVPVWSSPDATAPVGFGWG